MAFPTPPFTIPHAEEAADKLLVEYLRKSGTFSYLQKRTKDVIERELTPSSLRAQDSVLMKLWPMVLTDALRRLKQDDPREWDAADKSVDYGSFFHEDSLGVTELREVLQSFGEFESMLYGASPNRYRDHIAHAFRVWIMGHGILTDRACFAGSLLADSFSISSDEWECMWAIVALCHDLGYPLQHIDRINALARATLQRMGLVHSGDLRFSFTQQMLPFHETVIRLMASRPVKLADGSGFTTHLQNKYYLKLLKSFDRLDHGVVSAMLISKALVYFLESDLAHDQSRALAEQDARQFLIRREILRAMAAHTCQDIYHLQFNTLSFLLYMTDEIQCWGRPTLEELQHQPADIPAANAHVHAFDANRVAVVIQTPDGAWSNEQHEGARHQLQKLYRMLRLGVGTVALKDRYLEFAVGPAKGKGTHLLLQKGAITLVDIDMMNIECSR